MRRGLPLIAWASLAVLVACTSTGMRYQPRPAPPAMRYGAAMAEVGRRFEQIGRAGALGNWALLAYCVKALEAMWQKEMHDAKIPEGLPQDVSLPGLAESFEKNELPALGAAVAAHNVAGFSDAFSRASAACNACHRATGRPFILVPSRLGEKVPQLEPVEPAVLPGGVPWGR